MLLSEAREKRLRVQQRFDSPYGDWTVYEWWPGEGWFTHHFAKDGTAISSSWTVTLVDWTELKQDGWELVGDGSCERPVLKEG